METQAKKRRLFMPLTWPMVALMGPVVRHNLFPEKPHPTSEIPLFSYERDDSSALSLPSSDIGP
jgi:hypothetical protein